MTTYSQTKTCGSCGFEDARELDKRMAAFESTREWTTKCPKCGKRDFDSEMCEMPNTDAELLGIWGRDEDLMFSDQDEDLILGELDDISLLLAGMDNRDLLVSKRSILFSALCVIIYDHFSTGDSYGRQVGVIIQQLIEDLKARGDVLDEIDTEYVSDYIQTVVFPKIGLS